MFITDVFSLYRNISSLGAPDVMSKTSSSSKQSHITCMEVLSSIAYQKQAPNMV